MDNNPNKTNDLEFPAMQPHLMSSEDVFDDVRSSPNGLSSQDATEARDIFGANKLAEPPKVPLWKKFLAQFTDPMTIVLLVAATISFITSLIEGESLVDVFIILFVVVLNAVLGVIQENKAEKAIDALKAMTKATCKVLRDGNMIMLNNEELVPGDVILLEAGDAVPADARLFETASLKVEEAALTGEAVPVDKHPQILRGDNGSVPLGDRANMVYTGTTVVYGRGKAVVTGTGMKTEMGKIAKAITDAVDEKTPLQLKLSQLSKILTFAVLAICVVVFIINLITAGSLDGEVLLDTFMVAVSLAVAAIPEGLSAVVTIVLSMGVSKMANQRAIIRKLTAVETLGCTQIICSDKTGTLTQNKMTVVEYFTNNLDLLIKCNALCNDAAVNEHKPDTTIVGHMQVRDDNEYITGEPTEVALQAFAYNLGANKNELSALTPRVTEAPFDSMRKMMSTIHKVEDRYVQYTKGAPDVVLSKCSRYIDVDGTVKPMTPDMLSTIMSENKAMANKALRVIAAAYVEYNTLPEFNSPDEIETNMIFIGLNGMMDPVRPEVKAAVDKCRSAGIRPIMITGDHIDTAVAIGKELGIIENEDQALMGSMLDEMTDEQLMQDIHKYSVYARVQPEHKVRIVDTWKKLGYITAMTGDGANDSPAIKSADIGVGMGITGTDVTKGVADMILGDDNFATIVSAVEEGRRIYANIRKTIQFLLSSNLSEVISVFIASLFGFTIFKPVHILWINLITDTFPALGLGVEEAEDDIMSQPPRDRREGIFAGGLAMDIVVEGLMIAALTLMSFFIGNEMGFRLGTTMAFVTMSIAEIIHAFSLRSRDKSVFSLKTQNPILWATMVVSFILTVAVVFMPFLRDMFSFREITFWEFIVAVLIGALSLPITEAIKFFKYKRGS